MNLVNPNQNNPVFQQAQKGLSQIPRPSVRNTATIKDFYEYAGPKYGYITKYKEGL